MIIKLPEEFKYIQEGGKNYLKSVKVSENDYITGMLINNDIKGLVSAKFKSLNAQNHICYYMNGLIPLEQAFQINKLTGNRIEAFLRSLISVYNSMEDFLLPLDRLVVNKNYIYENYNKKNEFLWIYGNEMQPMNFTGLFEYLLDKMEYKDDKAVNMLYSLYQTAKDSEQLYNEDSGVNILISIKERAEKMLSTPTLDNAIKRNNGFDIEEREKFVENTEEAIQFYNEPVETYQEHLNFYEEYSRPYEKPSNFYKEQTEYLKRPASSYEKPVISCEKAEKVMQRNQNLGKEISEKTTIRDRLFKNKKVESKQKQKEKVKNKKSENENNGNGIKEKFKKVWKYLNADIGSKNSDKKSETETARERVDFVQEETANYNVRTVNAPTNYMRREPIEKPTTLLTGGIIENGIYCLSPHDNAENKILLTEYPFFIGKSESNVNVTIEDSTVSRYHARVDKEGEIFYITDLNSTNGTFLNGIRLLPYDRMKISRGDLLTISRKRYEFKFLG